MDRGASAVVYSPWGGKKWDTTASEQQMMRVGVGLPQEESVRTVRTLSL